jgi:hypothetical protein
MMRKHVLAFFFSILAFSLIFAFINAIGFQVVRIPELSIGETGIAVVLLSLISMCLAYLIGRRQLHPPRPH